MGIRMVVYGWFEKKLVVVRGHSRMIEQENQCATSILSMLMEQD